MPVDPRTWRIMSLRFTVSGQTVDASTVGAAGLSRETRTTATVKNHHSNAGPNEEAAPFLLLNVWACDIHHSRMGALAVPKSTAS